MALKLSTLIDRHAAQQEKVAEKSRDVTRAEAARDKEKAKLEKLENEIQDRFKNDEINGYTTAKGNRAELKPLTSASVFDWTKLTKYIKQNNAFELFQRRVNKAAWLEHLENRKGRPVPGIKRYDRVKLSITKTKR